jgi:voltage-gated potassium channel Kch
MWWCIVTLTTTGYGDLYPVTVGGRIVAGITMLVGLVLFGMLMNIVGKTLMVLLFGESLGNEEKHDPKPTNIKEAFNLLAEAGLITPKSAEELSKLDKMELSSKFDIK